MPNMLKTAPSELFHLWILLLVMIYLAFQSLMSAVRLLISSDEKVLVFYLCRQLFHNFYCTLDLWELSGGKGHSFDHSLKKEEANLSLVCKCYSDVIEHCN